MRARTIAVTLLLLVPAAGAYAAGGSPIAAEAGLSGVVIPDSAARYVTVASGRDTVLERIQRAGGQVSAARTLKGRWAVPAVALDGTAGGLSMDGSTLVLIKPQPRFPVARSPFLIVDTRTLRARQISLDGSFAFDALSPDGRSLYLTQYPSRDPTHPLVRRFDLARGRLAPGAIVDRRNPGEEMGGNALTRATSRDGRWAYTLYDGADHAPFVHALDTSRQRAFCIDLDLLEGSSQLWMLRLQLGSDGLRVMTRDETVATIDTRTFRVVAGGQSPAPPVGVASASGGGAGEWILPLGGGLAIALVIATTRFGRLRRAVARR